MNILYTKDNSWEEISNENIETLSDVGQVIYKIEDNNQDIFDFSDPLIDKILEKFPEAEVVGKIVSNDEEIDFDLRQAKAFLGVTEALKAMSKCTRLKVCCVIEKNGRIISTGVNGTPSGFKNCNEYFSPKDRLKKDYSTRHHEFSEAYEVHAEMNAVLELGKNSSMDSYNDLTLYCSTCPCPGCAKMIAQAGIKYVVYRDEYDRMPEGAKHLNKFGLYVFKC